MIFNTKKFNLILLILLIILILLGCESKEYTVQVQHNSGRGEVFGVGEYKEGTKATLLAEPKVGSEVKYWMKDGEVIGEDNELVVLVESDLNIELVYETQYYEVNVTSDDSTKGEVRGNGKYLSRKRIVLEAVPQYGYKFDGWYDGDTLISRDREFAFDIENDVNLEAKFSLAKEVTITLTTNEPNAVTEMLILSVNNNPKEVVREGDRIKIWINNMPKDDIEREKKDFYNYRYKGLYINGEQVTTDFTYEFIAEEDVEIQAIFEPFSFSDISIRESINQNIKENIDKPDVYDVVLASPSGKYILAVAESTAYILSQDGEKVLYAFELAITFDPKKKHDYEIHWLEDESGFYYYNKFSRDREDKQYFYIQNIDSTQKIIEMYNLKMSIDVGHEVSLHPANISIRSNWIGFALEYNDYTVLETHTIGMVLVDINAHDSYFKSINHTYSFGEWPDSFPGSFVFSKDSKKVLYTYYSGTGVIDLESFVDNKISDSIIQATVSVSPLRFENEKVFFYAGPHVWHGYFQHLFVLDMQTDEVSIINCNFSDSYSRYKTFESNSMKAALKFGVVYANLPVNKASSEVEIGSYIVNEEPVSYKSSNIEESISNLRNYYKSKENGEFYLSVFDKFSSMIRNSYSSVYEPEVLYNIKIETDKRFLKDVLVDSKGHHFVVLESRSSQNDSIILLVDNQGNYKRIYESSDTLKLLSVNEKVIMLAENIGNGYRIKLVNR